MAGRAQENSALNAARRHLCGDHLRRVGRALAEPLKPTFPALDQPMTFPFMSVIVTIVLLNVERTCAMPVVNVFAAFGFDDFGLVNLVGRKRKALRAEWRPAWLLPFCSWPASSPVWPLPRRWQAVDSETASARARAPTAAPDAACATPLFEALVGFFAFDVSALDLVVFF